MGGVRHPHIPELQSLRGLAATVVLLHHATRYVPVSSAVAFGLEAMLNAHAAVMIFFVMSGFVLTRSLMRQSMTLKSVSEFYGARLFRIYPALWFAGILVLLFVFTGCRDVAGDHATLWFRRLNEPAFSSYRFFGLLAGYPSSLLPPSWSITVEIVASLLIPVLVAAVRRGIVTWFLVQGAFLAIGLIFANKMVLPFLWAFALGAGLVMIVEHVSRWKAPVLSAIGAVALCTLWFFRLASPAWRFDANYNALAPAMVEMLAAAALLLAIIGQAPLLALLKAKWLVALGDRSYSLYLVHWVVMGVIGQFVLKNYVSHGGVAAWLLITFIAGMTFIASLSIAALTYQFVELPGIALGKAIIGRLKRCA